ncbi:MAG: highly derived d5-like helicase-primase: PROVISIONAL [Satyrvirus sp.]|uniref:Highly derived d5-like helicase-primase: PROVISIONAL n=1 Tax=Satyrvirus sp. TaxID=2487771 RepID=A0A3G5ADQ1_9VIRU|nr:MAG: highly derived d5-like helicase-primase: PROVISIONAL [Satyrvirus sp.]
MQLEISKEKKLDEMEKVYEFMAKYRVKAEEKTKMTHTTTYSPYISSKIPKDKEEKFIKLYENAIIKGHNLSIMEISKGFGPLVIKIKLVQDQEEKLYTEELLKQIIELCNGIIKKYLKVKSKKMGAYVLEHDEPIRRRKEYYYNIRIIYPNICIKDSLQIMMLKELSEIAKTNKIFDKKKFRNDMGEIINTEHGILMMAWALYGSKINKYISPPKITHIYGISNDSLINTIVQGKMDHESMKKYIRLLRIRRYTEDDIVKSLSEKEVYDLDGKMIKYDNKEQKEQKEEIFGTEIVNFSTNILDKLVHGGNINEAKTYIQKYFIKIGNPPGILMWTPSENKMSYYKFSDVKTLYIKRIVNNKFDIQIWFYNEEHTVYLQNLEVNKERIYEKCGQKYINIFPGFMHKIPKIYNDFTNDIKNKVKIVWSHIKNVWCSGQNDLYKYNKKWISHMISGRKMLTCLYLKSGQGTGKSLITEFIQQYVLGEKIVYITHDPDCLYSFNHQLLGNILLVLEELPAANKNQWYNISNSLKHFITGKTYTNKEKNKTDFEVKNNLSIIICTNNNAIKLETDDRRFVINDISHSKVDDHAYFAKLSDEINNEEVGEAFYWYCKEYALKYKDFREFPPPQTQAKRDLIIENLHSLFIYIKDKYIKEKEDIDIKFTDFYDDYCEFIKNFKIEAPSKIAISKLLTNYNLGLITKNSNIKHIRITANELYKIFNAKRWIHDIDDIEQLYD